MKEYEQKICNIMDNLKAEMRYQCDKVNEQAYKRGYAEGYEIGKQDGYEDGQESLVNAYAIGKGEDTLEDVKKAEYNRGLNDAWEVARKIIKDVIDGGYSSDVLREIFGVSTVQTIFKLNTAVEVIAKIKAYEDKQDAKIKVGDEVIIHDRDDDTEIVKALVVSVDGEYYGIVTNDRIVTLTWTHKKFVKKTGRTFPQIAEVITEMRGAENDE